MTLSIIAAVGENNELGKDNQLLWHLSEDLKRFKRLTTGHSIIMGRKTFDSIGRPLPNRRSIIITRQQDLQIEGCEVVHSLQEAIDLCENEEKVFIIGGAEIYSASIDRVDKIYLTKVKGNFEADAWFPSISKSDWESHPDGVINENGLEAQFIDLSRKK